MSGKPFATVAGVRFIKARAMNHPKGDDCSGLSETMVKKILSEQSPSVDSYVMDIHARPGKLRSASIDFEDMAIICGFQVKPIDPDTNRDARAFHLQGSYSAMRRLKASLRRWASASVAAVYACAEIQPADFKELPLNLRNISGKPIDDTISRERQATQKAGEGRLVVEKYGGVCYMHTERLG